MCTIAVLAVTWITATGTASAAPETTIDAGPAEGSTTNNRRPTFAFTSSEPGSTFACSLDGEPLAECESPQTLDPVADGPHAFAVTAIDLLGIPDETPASRSFKIDTAPPNTVITKRPPKKLVTRTRRVEVEFQFTSTEAGSRFECSLDGVAPAPCGSPATYRVGKGEHRFLVLVMDRAGNSDRAPATETFEVRRERPRRR
jgi:hypothetical protein